jgi:UDP:flavonoid glycosyltransferase YjiC (YdhE family)
MICLLPHCGYLSETSRMLVLQRALAARGAPVVVATQGGPHEKRLLESGVDYHVVGPRLSAARCRELVQAGAGMGHPGQSMWTDAEIETYVRAEAQFFREHNVRVAVTGFTLTALLSTRLAGIPLITEHAGSYVPPIWERNMIDPFLRSPLPLVDRLPYAVRRSIANIGIHNVKQYCAGFNRVAHKLGIQGVPSFASLLLGDLTLVPEAEEVLGIPAAELAAWRPSKRGYRAGARLEYVGPLFAELDIPVPERVERFLEGPRPIVYVAVTSTTTEQVAAVVRALEPAGVRVLVAGTLHDLSGLQRDNVMIEGVLPSHRVMPRVDLAITAGGQGSVQCALACGTPLISLPLQPEQDWNGQLVERQGAGKRMSLAHAASSKLPALVRQMLADESFRVNARRIQAIYAKLDGPGSAAEAIMRYSGIAAVQPLAARASACD